MPGWKNPCTIGVHLPGGHRVSPPESPENLIEECGQFPGILSRAHLAGHFEPEVLIVFEVDRDPYGEVLPGAHEIIV